MRSRSTTIATIVVSVLAVALVLWIAVAFDSPTSTFILALVAIGFAFLANTAAARRGRR